MTETEFPASAAGRRSEARGKIFAVGVSALISIIYSLASLRIFVPDSEAPSGWPFYVLAVAALITFLAGIVSPDVLPGDFDPDWRPDPKVQERILGGMLYLLSVLYIILLCWICIDTGGPVKSPYSIILLTIAVLSSAIARRSWPIIFIVLFVVGAYLVTALIYESQHRKTLEAPDWLVILTSIISVVISVGVEIIRREFANRREAKAAKAKPVQSSEPVQSSDSASDPML